MKNPWLELSDSPPFLLEMDREAVDSFNATCSDVDCRIITQELPEPYLGRLDAPLVLLNGNPGFDPNNRRLCQPGHPLQLVSRAVRALLGSEVRWPFWTLDPASKEYTGHGWWSRKLRPLMEALEGYATSGLSTAELLAQSILCVEFFPYHSKRFGNLPAIPSQRYGFYLISDALRRNAVIIVMRSKKRWFDAVEGLKDHPRVVCLSNPQNPTISQKNCGQGWEIVVTALQGCQRAA